MQTASLNWIALPPTHHTRYGPMVNTSVDVRWEANTQIWHTVTDEYKVASLLV